MLAMTLKRGLSVTAVGVALAIGGPGAIGAASAAPGKMVLSDTIQYKAQAKPGSTPGSFTFSNITCAVQSDGEKVVPCKISGMGNISPTGALAFSFSTFGPDGVIKGAGSGTGKSTGGFQFTGKGREKDNADVGQPPPPAYPCRVAGNGMINLGSGLITGTIIVTEASTQP